MAQTPTRLALATATTAPAYTVPAGKTVILKQIVLCNPNAGAQTGGYNSVGINGLGNLVTIPPIGAYATTVVDCSIVLNAGEAINIGIATGGSGTLSLHGVVSP